jgi:pilus assembly protein CpaE
MDADLQFGDISVNLNTRPDRTIADLVHDGEVDVELLPDVVLAHDTGLKLLLAPAEPQFADTILPDMVSDIIKEMKNLFKAIVIDTNSQLNDIALNVLEHADYVLVVTVPELPAIKSAKSFLELAARLEFPPEKLGVVVNRANEPGGVRPGQIAKVLKLEQPYLVPDEARLHMASFRGITIIQEDVNTPASKAFLQIASDIWQTLAEPDEAEEMVGAEVVA